MLVTGGVGFIGAAVVRLLHARGDEVRVIVRPDTPASRIGALPEGTTIHRGDLADPSTASKALEPSRPEVVIHAAASSGHARTSEQRMAAWRDDVIGTAALLEALRPSLPDRFVHVGSSLVYRPSSGPLGEDSALGPETFRGATKLAAATAVEQWSLETGIPAVVVRPFSVYGPGQHETRVIPVLLGSLASGSPFAIASAEPRRDFVHVDDVARCIVLAASRPGDDVPVLNVGTGVETSIKELISLAERITGRTVVPTKDPYPPPVPNRPHWRADSRLAAAVLGWTANISLEDGLAMLWRAQS